MILTSKKMSSQLLVEIFTYGNMTLLLKDNKIDYNDNVLTSKILQSIKDSLKYRKLESIWCIIWNIMVNTEINDLNYFKFIKGIFDILDTKFESDYTKVSFENLVTIKSFILNDISYIIDAYSISSYPIKDEILKYYSIEFNKELRYIVDFGILTRYNLPGEDQWRPEWTINYKDNIIKTSNIDIYLDHLITNSSIKYASNMNDVLEKIIERLTFLKCSPLYYQIIKSYIPEFSLHVFTNYPYYEVVKHYEKLMAMFDNVYIPKNIAKDDFKGLSIVFSVIPEMLSSYILGFPSISMGSLSQKLVSKFSKDIVEDREKYFDNLEERNADIIKNNMFFNKCANGYEESDVVNLLYNPVKSYNIDDIKIIMSNGVYFVFTYPEFDNLKKNEHNPYNRELISLNFLNYIRTYVIDKKKILISSSSRGLDLDLTGNMRENFDELITNIKIFKPKIYDDDVNVNRNNIINTVLNNLLTGNF